MTSRPCGRGLGHVLWARGGSGGGPSGRVGGRVGGVTSGPDPLIASPSSRCRLRFCFRFISYFPFSFLFSGLHFFLLAKRFHFFRKHSDVYDSAPRGHHKNIKSLQFQLRVGWRTLAERGVWGRAGGSTRAPSLTGVSHLTAPTQSEPGPRIHENGGPTRIETPWSVPSSFKNRPPDHATARPRRPGRLMGRPSPDRFIGRRSDKIRMIPVGSWLHIVITLDDD